MANPAVGKVTDVIQNTDNEAWKEIKGFIFSRFAGFDGETKDSLSPTFSIIFCIVFSFPRQSQSSLAMEKSPSTTRTASEAPFSLIDCQIEIGTANGRQKLYFTLNLIEQKKPHHVLDFSPAKKCNHLCVKLAFKGLFPDTLSQNTFYPRRCGKSLHTRYTAIAQNVTTSYMSFVTSFVSFFCLPCIPWFFPVFFMTHPQK